MFTPKFKLGSDTKTLKNGIVLHRIVALRDFDNVKAGNVGGWVEGEWNLSQSGSCWIRGEAKVWGNSEVSDDAQVWGLATVHDSVVCGCADISGHAKLFRGATVHQLAKVCGNAWVYDGAFVGGKTIVGDHARIHGANISIGYGDGDLVIVGFEEIWNAEKLHMFKLRFLRNKSANR